MTNEVFTAERALSASVVANFGYCGEVVGQSDPLVSLTCNSDDAIGRYIYFVRKSSANLFMNTIKVFGGPTFGPASCDSAT